ncbi:hypothetical protein [Bradyrhizobium sp. ORS 111]|uniref:hypothetical protein n=1 Tax=Bradyrhizobium sp. ORS 111 TaxID=1685958 RepID=UPI00388FF55A
MRNRKKQLAVTSLTLAAAAFASVAYASSASAQCQECAQYPDRDPFTQGLVVKQTPAPAVRPNSATLPRSTRNAHAEMRGYSGRSVGKAYHRHY